MLDGAQADRALMDANDERGALLLFGFDSAGPAVATQRMELKALARELGARPRPADLAEWWWDHRHDEAAWYEQVMGEDRSLGAGVIADTFDTAAVWRHIPKLYEEVRDALLDHAETVGCRLAHPYRSGAALEFPFVLRAADDHQVEDLYKTAWREAIARKDSGTRPSA